jgi:hypothetical protein
MLAASLQGGSEAGLWTSKDGREWEFVDSATWQSTWSDGTPRDVAGGHQGFVAVGVRAVGTVSSAVVAHSPDGRSWQPIDRPEVFQDAEVLDLIAYFNGYAIAGIASDPTTPDGAAIAVWVSGDGTEWVRAEVADSDVPIPGPIQLLSGPEGMALVSAEERLRGDSDRIVYTWSSADGHSWQRDPSPEWRPFAKMFASDGKRIIILGINDAAEGVGWISTDGMIWSRLWVSATGDVLFDISPRKAESMAIAPTGLVIWESSSTYQQFNGAWAVGD